MDKKIIIRKVITAVIILAIIVAGGLLLKSRLDKYEKAIALYNKDGYLLAYQNFDKLGGYRRSKEFKSDCAYKLAVELTDDNYEAAISYFDEVTDLDPGDYKYLKALYSYVADNPDKDNTKTMEYLGILQEQDYYGLDKILTKIYPWTIEVVAVNKDKSDTTTDMKSFSRFESIYFHYKVSGGTEGQKGSFNYKIYNADGTTASYGYINGSQEAGSEGWVSFSYRNPYYVSSGEIYIEFFDSYENSVGVRYITVTQ